MPTASARSKKAVVSRQTTPDRARRRNQRTLATYEHTADAYLEQVSLLPPAPVARALRRLAAVIPKGGRILEIGSGPGRDADFLESLGCRVRRTDATTAFIERQARRGRTVTPLNMLSDPLRGRFDAVLAMFVLIHIDRSRIDEVLDKIAGVLRPGGVLLAALWSGDRESFGRYHTTRWRRPAFQARLAAAGLVTEWHAANADEDGDRWFAVLARAVRR